MTHGCIVPAVGILRAYLSFHLISIFVLFFILFPFEPLVPPQTIARHKILHPRRLSPGQECSKRGKRIAPENGE